MSMVVGFQQLAWWSTVQARHVRRPSVGIWEFLLVATSRNGENGRNQREAGDAEACMGDASRDEHGDCFRVT